jgi:hypothetical protein
VKSSSRSWQAGGREFARSRRVSIGRRSRMYDAVYSLSWNPTTQDTTDGRLAHVTTFD